MAADKRVRAPYNFIPLSEKVLLPYNSIEELPPHDRMDPALKTGEIHVSMVADTPVFVSDGDKNEPHFFRGNNGKYMIPGSTIRGMVRENMQILGFGLMRTGEDLEDVQIYFREIASARESVGNALKEYYRSALDVQTKRTASGSTYTIPQNVCAGYLRREGQSYKIYPTKIPYIRVSRNHPDVVLLQTKHESADNACVVKVLYQMEGERVKHISRHVEGTSVGQMMKGFLLYTGNPVGRKENHLYLFPEADADAIPLDISREDIISYTEDWENRRNSLRGGGYDPDFWALPEDGEQKPVFYLRHEGHTYWGMSLFLRIGYVHPISDGLPQRHRELQSLSEMPIDYPHAILGFAEDDGRAYRSRVSFSDFGAEGNPQEMPELRTVLGGPKPSYYPGYLADGKNYNDEDFRIRGYKQYWLKELQLTEGKDTVASKLRPLPKGTKFSGVVRYKNLTDEELGLLLWSLRLEDGCYQTIGMGKPCGLGRMKLTIRELKEFSPTELYLSGSFSATAQVHDSEAVNKYIEIYDAAAGGKSSKKPSPLHKRKELKDFFFMKKEIRTAEDTSYMTLVTSDGEDGGTLSDMVADDRSGREATQRLNVDESLCELITLILLLPQRLSGQANNPVKIKYFRMFFTDSMVLSVHTMEMEYLHKRQRDIFEAMCIPFLDFFMRDICRSLEEILASDLKLHGEMVEGRAMKRPEQPLPNDVYRQYMRVVEHIEIRSDGAISNQRASYYQFLKERLC